MEYSTFIGIDPGKLGGICVITEGKSSMYPVPAHPDYDIWKMHMILKDYASSKSFAVIERAQAMPGQGVVSMFEFGRGYGIWLALLTVNYIPFKEVHSRVWTKEMLSGSPGEGKERNVRAAKRLFSRWSPQTKKEEGLCDCILLAEYAKRLYSQGGAKNEKPSS
jgi:crossover junction endodeoxyribonuclease RuvC